MFTNFDLIALYMTTDLTVEKQILSLTLIIVFSLTAHARDLNALAQTTEYAASKHDNDVIIVKNTNTPLIPLGLSFNSKLKQVKIVLMRDQVAIQEKQALESGQRVDL